MWNHVLLIASPKDSAATCLAKVLAHVTDHQIEPVLILQTRGDALITELENLKSKAGYRVLLGIGSDGIWEASVAIVLRQGSDNDYNPVLICGSSLLGKTFDQTGLIVLPIPLNLASLLRSLTKVAPDLGRLTYADVEAAKLFLQVGWHDLKYDLLKSYELRQESIQVHKYFQFLDNYNSAPVIKLLLGDIGSRVFELGSVNRLAYEQRDDGQWNASYELLFASFNAMDHLSPRR